MMFETMQLPENPDVTAPDGSDVRILFQRPGGSMAHFCLQPGRVSRAVVHRTVEEIWFFTVGEGQVWRKSAAIEKVDSVRAGTCITIPVGTSFQFRATGFEALAAVAVTMPPWPGEGEAITVEGRWEPVLE
jgi:mannose-6-phosphate isomerase-like protein (cupin superfamily)